METGNSYRFNILNKGITVYTSKTPDSPVIYLHTFEGEGDAVYWALQEMGCREVTLAAVSGLSWNHDMSPWAIPAVSKKEIPCTGGADAYLQVLTEEIMPAVEKLAPGKVLWRGIAGYSLAGLFALYTMYRTEVFSRIASVSGSLWFPGFREYIFSRKMKTVPECLYFSLGDKECRTRHPVRKAVQECTELIEAYYRSKGIHTAYELNPGNHFQDVVLRTASGIAWIADKW